MLSSVDYNLLYLVYTNIFPAPFCLIPFCQLIQYQTNIHVLMHAFWLQKACNTENYIIKAMYIILVTDRWTQPSLQVKTEFTSNVKSYFPIDLRTYFWFFSDHLSKEENKCCIVTSQQHPRIPSKWLHRETKLPAGASGSLPNGHLCFTVKRIIKLFAR